MLIASVSWISPPWPGRELAQNLEDLGGENVAADQSEIRRGEGRAGLLHRPDHVEGPVDDLGAGDDHAVL